MTTERQKYALHLAFWAELSRQAAAAFSDRGLMTEAYRADDDADRFARLARRLAL